MASKAEILITAQDRSNSAFRSVERSLGGLHSASRALTGALSGIASALGVRELGQMADSYQNLQSRLKLATRNAEEFALANENIKRIAASTRAPLEDTATLYTRISAAMIRVGRTQKEVSDTTEAFALALRISGVSASEAAGALQQFSQVAIKGRMSGDEFSSLTENAQRFITALQDGAKISGEQMMKLAKDQKLSFDLITSALGSQLPKLREEAATIPITISAAFTDLKNQALLAVGEIDKITGASTKAAEAIGLISSGIQGWKNFISPSDEQQIDRRLEGIRFEMDAILARRKLLAAVGLDSSGFWSDDLQKLNSEALKLQQSLVKLQGASAKTEEIKPPKPITPIDENLLKRQQTFIENLKKEASTLGATSVQLKLYEAGILKITGAKLASVKADAEKVERYKEEQESLESMRDAYADAADTYHKFLRQLDDDSKSSATGVDRLNLELGLMDKTESARSRALAQYDLEVTFKKKLLELDQLGLGESVKRMQEDALSRWKVNEEEKIRLGNMVDQHRDASQRISQFSIQAARNAQTAFADFLFDPFENGLKGMASGFLDTVRRMAANAASAGIFNALLGDGRDNKGLLGDVFSSAIGSMFGNVKGFASGGMHSGGLRLVGENGPELEMTGPSRIFNANETRYMLNGGGGDNITLNLTIQTGVQQTVRAEVMSMVPAIKKEVIAGVANAKARGGRMGNSL